jgi:hypothetical protein
MPNLSPAAQAVLDASMVTSGSPPPRRHRECIAAALRALVNDGVHHDRHIETHDDYTDKILAIATELENTDA